MVGSRSSYRQRRHSSVQYSRAAAAIAAAAAATFGNNRRRTSNSRFLNAAPLTRGSAGASGSCASQLMMSVTDMHGGGMLPTTGGTWAGGSTGGRVASVQMMSEMQNTLQLQQQSVAAAALSAQAQLQLMQDATPVHQTTTTQHVDATAAQWLQPAHVGLPAQALHADCCWDAGAHRPSEGLAAGVLDIRTPLLAPAAQQPTENKPMTHWVRLYNLE